MKWLTIPELVDLGTQSPDVDTFRARCLARLAPLVGCDAALMQDAWPGASAVQGGCLHIPFDRVAHIVRYLPHYRADMLPLLGYVANQRVGVDVEVLGRRQVKTLRLTREVIAPLGLGDVMIAAVPRRAASRVTLLNFLRNAGSTLRYAEKTREHLRSLVPVLSLCSDAFGSPLAGEALGAVEYHERALVEWLRLGYSNQQIATILQMSLPAVKNRLLRMFKRLGVESRTELLCALGLIKAD